ncbi:MAG: HAMP domain-containing histidine kinase [Dehalococcoidales bacterium]|nr:HAMP domain-containing histidine kinase [Dehalococcoidales bacterium]
MTLRTRLLLSFMLIVVVSLGIAAVAVSVLLQKDYRDQAAMARMDDMTRPIYVQIRSLLRGTTTLAEVWELIQEQADSNNTWILFVDDKGHILRQASPGGPDENLAATEGIPHGISQPVHGTFSTDDGQVYIYSAYPLGRVIDTLLSRPQTLVLCQPRSSLATILAGLVGPFIWSAVIALLISLLLAYFMSRSVYRPIQKLSQAADNIALGHYDQTVPVSGTREIRALAVSFNGMAARVKESQLQLRHFVADVSHQLKSPLTSIQGFAQAVLDGTAGDEEKRIKALRIISDESKRMIRQVNELLDLSRMQAGQIKMTREPVDIKALLSHCEEIFAPRLEEKNIKLTGRLEVSTEIMGDIDRLEDVFSNLLDNAIKNAPSRGEILVEAQETPGKTVNVIIEDNGPGIPPEQIPYVFDRFHQSGGLRSGFGLGLAIAREIVLAHGGEIEVSSQPGEGACFTVTLPSIRS